MNKNFTPNVLKNSDQNTQNMLEDEASLAQIWSEFAFNTNAETIPENVKSQAKYFILDALGTAFACQSQPFVSAIYSGLASMPEPATHSIIGKQTKLSLRNAAIMNGALIHGLDFDDTHLKAVVHGTAATLPGVLVMGETCDAPGKELLRAYILGMELCIRIGMAANFGFHENGMHATGIVSHFSSALTSGLLLGLSAEHLAMALGLVGSTAQGSQQFVDDGAWNKRFHPGWGAAAGITAAYLAASDFRAPKRVFEGRYGLFTNLTSAHTQPDISAITNDLGIDWSFISSAIKPYPTCHFTHALIDAALILRKNPACRLEQIESIDIHMPEEVIPIIAEPTERKKQPGNEYDAKFSAPYVVATALQRGQFGLKELHEEALRDPRSIALSMRTCCIPQKQTEFPKVYPGGVTIKFYDGSTLSHYEQINRGAEERALSHHEIFEKFLQNASMFLSNRQAHDIAEMILHLEHISGAELARALRT